MKGGGRLLVMAGPTENGILENLYSLLSDYGVEANEGFVVEEDRSMFSSQVRLRLVREGTAHLPNVRVHPSGHYMISSATFPTYFLKQEEDATAMQCALDCTVFAQCIAPPLHIRTRFVGQEPLDPVTAQYNAAMAALLPRHGVQVREIPRLEVDGQPVSASRVRRLLKEKGLCPEVLSLVPPTTAAYLQESFAQE